MLNLWEEANGQNEIKPMLATICRLVESQEQAATLSLVQNVYEQGILEDLLETTKSELPSATESLHYLLKTPFRYPPLQHGSRFGNTFETGIFYGSLSILTALAETAYYRFVYMLGPETPFSGVISSELTEFSVKIMSDRAILLDQPPFSNYETILTSPVSYSTTQFLGSRMRAAGVEAVRYISARDKDLGKNVAIFTPKAFYSSKPNHFAGWLCHTSVKEVGFIAKESNMRLSYSQQQFWVGNHFPSPAA